MTHPYRQALRETCIHIRNQLSPAYRLAVSNKVCARIRQLDLYRNAKRIALYQAANGEIDLSNIWRTAPLHGKYCYFPIIKEDYSLSFLPATPSSVFKDNRFGIAEPQVPDSEAIAPHELQIMFIPLVAFDHFGTRLGMGAGYYDRTLATSRPSWLIGVAYEFQREAFIEANPWDVPLDIIITERAIYEYNT